MGESVPRVNPRSTRTARECGESPQRFRRARIHGRPMRDVRGGRLARARKAASSSRLLRASSIGTNKPRYRAANGARPGSQCGSWFKPPERKKRGGPASRAACGYGAGRAWRTKPCKLGGIASFRANARLAPGQAMRRIRNGSFCNLLRFNRARCGPVAHSVNVGRFSGRLH